MELWDTYDENETRVGIELLRGEEIAKGFLHAVVVSIVRHADGSYLLMQRDWNKSKFLGLWEAGASGCVLKGEGFVEAVQRELLEEIGIRGENFKLLYTTTGPETNVFYKVYLCECQIDKNSVVLQKGETIAYRWSDEEEFIEFIGSKYFINPDPKVLSNFIVNKFKFMGVCNGRIYF